MKLIFLRVWKTVRLFQKNIYDFNIVIRKVREEKQMVFCTNCGQELAEEAKFCANCGKAVDNNNSTNQRRTVYDGEIHKCPNCGEILSSFITVCPTCGHELRGTTANNSSRFPSKLTVT